MTKAKKPGRRWLTYFLISVDIALVILILPVSCDDIIGTESGFSHQELSDFEKNYFQADYFVMLTTANGRLAGSVFQYEGDNKYYVLTVAHIKRPRERLTNIMVHFRNQFPEEAVLVGYDRDLDIAVLAFTDPNFIFIGRPARFGSAASLKEGDKVMIMGRDNEKTLGHYITYLWSYFIEEPLICSAAARPGYSGGPIINQEGEIVGVVNRGTVHLLTGKTNLSIGTKIDYVKPILRDLINGVRR